MVRLAILKRLCAAMFAVPLLLAPGLPAGSQDLPLVRVGVVNSISDVVFSIGDRLGYFKEEGLRVEMVSFKSAADMVVPLGAGQLDVGGGAPSAGLYNAVARGIDLHVVADKGSDPPGYGFGPLIVRSELVRNGRYKTLKDLKGMTIAVSSPGSGSFAALDRLTKKAGLKYSDVKPVSLGYPDHIVALRNGSVDAGITIEPNATEAVLTGAAVRIMDSDKFYPYQQVAAVIYSGAFSKSRHDVGERFMRGYIRAARTYNDALANGKLAGPRADEVIKILTDVTPIKDPAVYRAITPNGLDPNGKLNVASLRDDFAFFKSQGLITGSVKPEDVIDESYVNNALRKLGRYHPAKR